MGNPSPNFFNFTNPVLQQCWCLFLFIHIITIFFALFVTILLTPNISLPWSFSFCLKYILLSISFAKSLLTINYLSFCSSKPISIWSSFFKHKFCWLCNCRLTILSFSTCKTLSYSILVSVNCSWEIRHQAGKLSCLGSF